MKLINRYLVLVLLPGALYLAAINNPGVNAAGPFKVIKLVADTTGTAPHKDIRMKNPWGMAFFPGGPFWIDDEATGVSELIDGKGNIISGLPFVTIPSPPGKMEGSRPTGIVTNSTSEFALGASGPASFIFDSIDGLITGWNGGNKAVIAVNDSNTAQFTGLAMATNNAVPFLYAANSIGGINVFDGKFKPVSTTGKFVDAKIPKAFTPYGIGNIDGNLIVTYSQRFKPGGFVDEFDPDGTLIKRFVGGTLNQPWGIAIAPKNFGPFTNDLLIGNFGNGTINAYNAKTGHFIGQLLGTNGKPLVIPGLWEIVPGGNASGVTNGNSLYFCSGPNSQKDGLFGFIVPASRPPTPTPTKKPGATPTATPTMRKPTPTPTFGYY